MKLAATQALYGYWLSQCRGRCAPDRHDIDPADMRGMLPDTFMLEVGGPSGPFPIRISGTRFDALLGRNLKGVAFVDLWAADDRFALQGILSDVLEEARPALVGLRGAPAGYAPESFELLILPLRHHGRTHARLLCGLFAARTPSWLGLRSACDLSLKSWRMVDPRGEPSAERPGSAVLRRDHLLVYQGGRGGDVHSAPSLQSRVNGRVAGSRDVLLSIRGL